MKSYIICIGLICMGLHLGMAQVKIGENLQTLDEASLLELESTTRALVLTRVTQTEMNSISPLHGAMVYNIDADCVFVFDGLVWKNLCGSGISVITTTVAPTGSQIGDIWINPSNNWVSVWNGTDFISMSANPKSGNGAPSVITVDDPIPGDLYVDRTNGNLYTYNGSQWIIQGGGFSVANGLTETGSNIVELGGNLIKPTVLETDNVNTMAIQGLTEENDLLRAVVTLDGATGVLGKTSRSSLVHIEETVVLASNGQNQFATPMTISDTGKIDVYRNGVKIDFTVVNANTIELHPSATCFQNDEVRIVQIF